MDKLTQPPHTNSSYLSKQRLPSGPTGMARRIEARIADLEERRKECRRSADRVPLNERLHALDELLCWCRTRKDYRTEPTQPL